VAGFNTGIAEKMKSSGDLMKQWASDASNAFDVSNVVVPDMGVEYSVNREFFDIIDTKAPVSYDPPSYNFKAGISAELNAALSGIIDYEKMAKAMVPIVANALEHADIKAKIGPQEVWNSTKDSWNQDYRKLKKAPIPI